MLSYMIKISVGIAYEQNQPTGVASALRAQFGFLGEKCLKNALYKKKFRQKLLQITMRNFWCKNIFDRPTGVASALLAQFGFLVKSALKMRCTKFSYEIKVVTNQYPQVLCYVTFFDILHHYGVIAASQICSVEKVLCRLTEQIFTPSTIRSIEKVLQLPKKSISRFWWIFTFWGPLSPKKSFSACRLSVCLSVCLCVCVCVCVCVSVCLWTP